MIDQLDPNEPLSAELAFGSALHSAINACLTEECDEQELFLTYWNSYENLEYGRFNHHEMMLIGLTLLKKFRKAYKPRLVPHTMEVRLYSEYKGIKLEGTMDYVGDYDGVLTLFDWKTTTYPYNKDKALNSLQLYLYAYLCQESLGVTPKQLGYLPFVKPTAAIQTPIIIPFENNKMLAMLNDMVEYVKTMSKEYPRNPNSCIQGKMVCPFFDRCWK